MVSKPDEIVKLSQSVCSCGRDLSSQDKGIVERRQCFDLPEVRLHVTEYQRLGCLCEYCGAYGVGEFPSQIKAPVQYGSGRNRIPYPGLWMWRTSSLA